MEDYIAAANTSENVIEDVVAGTEEQSQFVDDNSAQFEQGYEDVVQSEEVPETSNVDWQGESKKWQSLYDKSQDQLNKIEGALTKAVEMQQTPQNATVNQPIEQAPPVSEEEFNPWDA